MAHHLTEQRLIRAAIVDDERLSRRRIRELLSAERDIVIVGDYGRVSEAMAGLTATPAELLFLDVQMPRATGFELLSRLPTRPAAVIFATAHAEYAIDAFGVAAIDYLVKPFDDQRFRHSVERAREHLQTRPDLLVARQLAGLLGGPQRTFLRRLAVKRSGAVVFLRVDEVDWIETAGNYVRIHTGKAAYLLREALARMEEQLDPEQFVRVNRSAIVNLDRIARLLPHFEGDFLVELRDGTRLPLLAKYRQRVQEVAGRF